MDPGAAGGRVCPGLAEIGERLRRLRQAAGQTLADVEAATHIRAAYLDALERGLPERMPAEVYVRGFLRTYADYLGLDGAAVVADYKASRSGEAAAAHGAEPQAAGSPRAASRRRRPSPTEGRGLPASPAGWPAPIAAGAPGGARGAGREQAGAVPELSTQLLRERRAARARARLRRQRQGRSGAARWLAAVALAGLTGWGGFTLAGRWLALSAARPGVPHATATGSGATPAAATAPGASSGTTATAGGTTATAGGTTATAGGTTATAGGTTATAGSGATAARGTASPTSARTSARVRASSHHTPLGWETTYTVTGAAALHVDVAATGRIWMRHWVDGSTAYTDNLLLPGERLAWTAQRTLRVQLGNTHLTITVNGQTMEPLPKQDMNPEWLIFQRSA